MPEQSLFLVFANAAEGQDEEFNRWYDARHLPDVLKVPGITSGQRYTLAEFEDPAGVVAKPKHRYLAAYTIETEPENVMKEFMARLAGGEMDVSPSMDMASISMTFWSPSGPRRASET